MALPTFSWDTVGSSDRDDDPPSSSNRREDGETPAEIRARVGKREAVDDLEGIYVGADTRVAGILRQESSRTVEARAHRPEKCGAGSHEVLVAKPPVNLDESPPAGNAGTLPLIRSLVNRPGESKAATPRRRTRELVSSSGSRYPFSPESG